MSRPAPLLLAALLVLLMLTSAVRAAERVALVVGNGAYRTVPALANAANDGRAVAAALRELGFEVFEGIDLDAASTTALLRDFARALDGAAVGLFYYAGHGMQVGGENYLVPVDARLEHESDLNFETLKVKQVLSLLESSDRTSIVVLDACRDNPFAQQLARKITRSRSVSSGLAAIRSGVGTLIAYATEPENVALDGTGPNSPFTTALLKYLRTPGLEVRQLMTRVRQDVIAATDRAQVPWDHSSLVGDFYFVPPASTPAETAAPAPDLVVALTTDEQRLWDATQRIADPGTKQRALGDYLERYPQGSFATMARLQLDDLGRSSRTADDDDGAAAARPDPPPRLDPPEAVTERALGLDGPARARVQLVLSRLGYPTGGADGLFGPRTRAQIGAFQTASGLPTTGYLDDATMARLEDAARRLPPAPPAQPPRAQAAAPPAQGSVPATAPKATPPGGLVLCRGPDDPAWMDERLITVAQCNAINGAWRLP
jgi:peptidoglycan hydrolase-like protein with peptidoglycan-binding domain